MYLLDTNIVSDVRRRTPEAVSWLRSVRPEALFLSAITLGEIAKGIALKRRRDRIAAGHLGIWLQATRHDYASRILPVTEAIAIEWGRIAALRTRGDADGLIAATAVVHGLIIVTRNVADFDDCDAPLLNPWSLSG